METHDHAMSLTGRQQSKFELVWQQLIQQPAVRWLRNNALILVAVPWAITASLFAFSGSTAPNIRVIPLSADPLYAATGGDKPVLALALSVEFPTVGAQYRGSNDYNNTTEFLGYYDAESCYTYIDTPTETPGTGQTAADFKRFQRVGAATSRMCNVSYPNAFSGNFLNWASNSAIDMLRLALTGGDRSVDSATLTLLQRAFLPNGDYEDGCFFNNGSYFPAKQLQKSAGTGIPNYFGAVPVALQTAAGTNDIWIGNKLNKIYFRAGSASTGSCTDTSGYTLGTSSASSTSWMGTITSYNSMPNGWDATPVYAAGDTITLTGVQEVLYGRTSQNGSNWKSAPASGTIICDNPPFTNGSASDKATCYVRAYTGSEAPPASGALTTDAFFYARVEVCERNPSTFALTQARDYGNDADGNKYEYCRAYSDGATTAHPNYKPIGVIQKYSDQLRLAAFGYLMDQAGGSTSGWGTYSARYGGVLRAPMKYVGAKTFNESGVENTGGNAKAEWNATTGVFIADPEGPTTTFAKSGVINYLNQFGRTDSARLGRYKSYDPVGELYGEALRYLQGLGPTADAVSSITGQEDGYPVYTSWTDPYGGARTSSDNYACLKSNIVVIGDVNTWDSNRLFTRTADLTNNLPNFNTWNTVVNNFESKTGGTYSDGLGITQTISNPNTANTNSQNGANGQQGPLKAQAYWAHTHDIRGTDWSAQPTLQRPGLRVKTFLFDVNENSASNSDSYRRTQNQYFTAAKYGGFETNAANAADTFKRESNTPKKSTAKTYNTKGNPFYQDDLTTADQYVWQDTDARTSRVGEANTYFLQSDARSVLSAFNDIFGRIVTASSNIAGGAIQSGKLQVDTANAIYQGSFDTTDWSGNLTSTPISVDSSNVLTVDTTPNWTAAAQLGALPSPATSRTIVVGIINASVATATAAATAFTWADIEQALKDNLDKASPSAAADGFGQDRLNYLRGDRSKEGSPFRSRSKLLGDIINSGVVYSGAPTTSISSSTYVSFASTNAARTAAVFVGANDGMLHAFNASKLISDGGGNELFAYIPSWLGSKLSALTSKAYNNAHQSYVDATPAVAEAQVGSAGTAADWKTVLVGGTGGGGQGVFALDVTDPSAFSASKVMWEFTNNDDADMGFVTGRPQILKLRTSAYNATSLTYKWFAVVPSGVNNYASANSSGQFSDGKPALFLLDLSKAVGTAWALGTNYYKVSLPFVSATSGITPATGLVNFAATLGNAGEVAQMYMGDLHGQLWKLDFSLLGSADWTMDKLSAFNKGDTTTPAPYPLYIANDSAGNVQPITMAPSVAPGSTPTTQYVVFGTGKYMETADKSATAQQSVYMIYDDNTVTSGDASPVGASAISSRSRLRAGSSTASTGAVVVQPFVAGRSTSNTDDLAATTVRSGCFYDFSTSGERQISSAAILGDKAVFSSLIPGSGSTSSCSAAGGDGKQYTINICGNGSANGSDIGLPAPPLLIELPGATTRTISDSTGRRTKTVTYAVIQQGSGGIGGTPTTTTVTSTIGRLSWRQINNYQDVKAAP